MNMIRPTLFLHFHLAEDSVSEDNIAEIKRSYSHIGPHTIDTRTDEEGNPVHGNIICLDFKARMPYWDKQNTEAQEAWTEVITTSFKNGFHKVSLAMTGLNGVHNEHRKNGIYFSWMQLPILNGPTIMVHLNSDSSIEAEALPFVEQVRNLCAANKWNDIKTVYIPDPEAFNRQEDAAEQERERALEEEAARAKEAAEAQAATKTEAESLAQTDAVPKSAVVPSQAESPASTDEEAVKENIAEDSVTKTVSDASEDSLDEDESTQEPKEEPFVDTAAPLAFDIDFNTWKIERADGSTFTYTI